MLLLLNFWFLKRWLIEVNGAPGTLYANETYQLQAEFPEHYPIKAPQVDIRCGFLLKFLIEIPIILIRADYIDAGDIFASSSFAPWYL